MALNNLDKEADAPWWRGLAQRLEAMTEPDQAAKEAALTRQAGLTKPPGALGRLEDIAVWLAGWQGRERPMLNNARMVVFAGNHGVTAKGVSPYPSSVTAQMVANFQSGGAAICQLCNAYDASLEVVDLDLDRPTADFTEKPAMERSECLDALNRGAEAVSADTDILMLGEMGIGNTSAAAALALALLGGEPETWVGPGTGLNKEGVARKINIITDALALHRDHCSHPFEALRRVGGRELAAIVGAVLEARMHRIPVILDGYVCCAAALVLEQARGGALDHCLVGHMSSEPGHRKLLEAMNKEPLLDLAMRLGEGTGAAVALGVVRGAVATHSGMATFAEAGVDNRD